MLCCKCLCTNDGRKKEQNNALCVTFRDSGNYLLANEDRQKKEEIWGVARVATVIIINLVDI
jgi:hypothetical protein